MLQVVEGEFVFEYGGQTMIAQPQSYSSALMQSGKDGKDGKDGEDGSSSVLVIALVVVFSLLAVVIIVGIVLYVRSNFLL